LELKLLTVLKGFDRDAAKIKDKSLLQKLRSFISNGENAGNISKKLSHVKKIEGYDSFYRVKIGYYPLGRN
jgi:mRNA interferase RelE/StbE